MRQALAGVFALAGAALTEPGMPATVHARLEQIVEQAEWLAELIQHCLGSEPPDSADRLLDLSALVQEAAAAERVTYAGQLEVARTAASVITRGDRVSIRRIIANLLSNATRAAGPRGRVRIEVGYDDDRALLVIDDSGPGFGRIQAGTGLGMHAVSRSMNGCAGRMEYDHGQLGGVRVRLWLPAI
jgi:signal transduction histidine kinase